MKGGDDDQSDCCGGMYPKSRVAQRCSFWTSDQRIYRQARGEDELVESDIIDDGGLVYQREVIDHETALY
jgi:hypothetical protein